MGLLLVIGATACTQGDGEAFSAGLEGGEDTEGDTEGPGDAACGNGVVEPGESCDLGQDNAPGASCTPECQTNVCGDGYLRPVSEDCDDGNSDSTDACTSECAANVCGDGFVHAGVEQCDDGNSVDVDDCKNDCTLGSCGDGYVSGDEECDDANTDDTDACAACKFATCGDGIIWAGTEQCDDGNRVDDDSCINACTVAVCGDGVVWAGEETCDDGNFGDDDACPSSCEPAYCGDGFVWLGEETCDDTNNVSDDGCDANCSAEYCALVDNGPDEDVLGNTWLDACTDVPGSLVVVKLRDAQGNVVYEAQGTMVGDWTREELTSTGNPSIEYNENSHDRMISLDNGDKLFIAGKDSNPGDANYFCNTDLGNGYGIVIYPGTPNWYYNAKLVVMSYEGGHSNQPRQFKNWGMDYEISYDGGTPMNLCTQGAGGLVPFKGVFTLRVL